MDDMDRYYWDSEMYRRYPEMYRRLYPKVYDCISRYIREKGEDWDPSDRELEEMTDEIYERMMKECPEIDEDLDERRYGVSSDVDAMQRPFYGRRRIFRDLITIILLGSLLGRRRRRRRYYDYPGYGYGPGYWY
ncbi:hypothetical protein [Proteiniborus sp.]|uniref:hypothetical protein n=1 Tax=Proteiniborus sp. TaxID=2079015 RepID=UPI00331F00DC